MPHTKSRQRDRTRANHGAQRTRSDPAPSSSSSTQHSHHQTPLSKDHLYGMIMWLPPEDESLRINQPPYVQTIGSLCGFERGSRCYDHPVLVLSPVLNSLLTVIGSADPDHHPNETVTILMITSFGGRGILEKFPSPSNVKQRRTYLPISPAHPHPDLSDIPVLELKGGLEMAKKSYVDISQKHEVPRQALRQYRMSGNRRGGSDDDLSGVRYVLTKESYLIVAKQAIYSIPTIATGISVSIPVALPSPPPSPSNPRAHRRFSPPPTTFEHRVGLTNSARGILTNTPSTTCTSQPPPSTLFENFQAERVRPDALNPGRGIRVAATRTEVTPLLPVHVYQSEGRPGRRSDSPRRRARAGYYPVGGAPSHPQTRDGLIAVCVALALLAGAGCGFWAAWVYRAAIGRGLLMSGRWIVENGWGVVKSVLKFGWRVLLSIVKWVGGVVQGAAGWAWEKLKEILG